MQTNKVVFMGTPFFAKEALAYLVENDVNVVAVVTTPDKPSGRGQKVHTSAVKDYAVEKQLPILQPEKLKAQNFIDTLKEIDADLFVVVAFRMLPEVIWALPPKGTINLHASLLPQYRGAAPINWAIINGEQETGVTTFFIEKDIDTGKIIGSKKVAITENMNVGELHDALLKEGSLLLYDTINAIFEGSNKAIAQSNKGTNLKHAPKIFKADCQIDWHQTSQQIHNTIRGLSPYPAAWTNINLKGSNKTLKLFESKCTALPCNVSPGTIKVENKSIFVATQDDWLQITMLQLEGKKKMDANAFVLGVDVVGAEFCFIAPK